MFEGSLFESGGQIQTKRGVTTAVSVLAQSLLLGAAVLMPLLYTEALPSRQMLVDYMPLPPQGAPPAGRTREAHQRQSVIRSEYEDGRLRQPGRIPTHTTEIHDVAAPDIGNALPSDSVPWGTRQGPPGVPDGILNGRPAAAPRYEPPARVNISQGVTLGHLVLRIEPVYPKLAIAARIQGDVVLHAIIGRDGTIQNLSLVTGHPLLAQAAIDAVRRWRYQPFLLSGQPIEVETEVTVRFRF